MSGPTGSDRPLVARQRAAEGARGPRRRTTRELGWRPSAVASGVLEGARLLAFNFPNLRPLSAQEPTFLICISNGSDGAMPEANDYLFLLFRA